MTNEEALKYLKGTAIGEYGYTIAPIKTEVLYTAIEAIEKQIPMIPKKEGHGFYCSNCGHFAFWDDTVRDESDSYCTKCGQRILFEEVSE